jgi:hypothetical protein
MLVSENENRRDIIKSNVDIGCQMIVKIHYG